MLNIAFLIGSNGIAGGTFVIYRHAHHLKSKGYKVCLIFCNIDKPHKVFFPDFNLDCYKLDDIENTDAKFDIVFATWWDTFYRLPKVKSDRYLYFCQSDERRFYTIDPVSQYDRNSAHFVQLTYTVNSIGFITEAKWIQSMLSREFGSHVEYSPNGIDNQVFNPQVVPTEARPADKLRFLIEGPANVPFKKIDLAFKAVEPFRNQIEVWYISSDGNCNESWKPDRTFKKVPFQDMPSIYRSCHWLVKLSTVEGFFGPPLEMMAVGGACIVSNVSGHEEYIIPDKNALVVPMNDLSLTQTAISRAISGGIPFFERYSNEGVNTARNLDWSIQLPKFEHAILRLIDRVPMVDAESLNFIKTMSRARDCYYYCRWLDHTSIWGAVKNIFIILSWRLKLVKSLTFDQKDEILPSPPKTPFSSIPRIRFQDAQNGN